MKITCPQTIARFAGAALFAAATVWTARADYPAMILSNSPVGYWRLTETNMSPPLNIISNFSTQGALVNGIAINDTVTNGQPGRIGTSVGFYADPASTLAEIDMPWNALINSEPPFSIEFWCLPSATTLAYTAGGIGPCPLSSMDTSHYGGGNRQGWLFYINDGSPGIWDFRLGSTTGYYADCLQTTGAPSGSNTWSHIVATYDGTNVLLYLNGVLAGSTTAALSGWSPNYEAVLRVGNNTLTGGNATGNAIAYNGYEGNRNYNGFMQQIAIYTNVLSPARINAHYMAASTNNSGYATNLLLVDHPVAYWPMNDPLVIDPTNPYPVAVNSGSASAADGTNFWGALAAQPGPGYEGFGTDTNAVYFDGENGSLQISNSQDLLNLQGGLITMAAWVKPTKQDYYRNIISEGYDENFAQTFLQISPASFQGPLDEGSFGDGNYYAVGTTDGANYYDNAAWPIPPGDIGNWVFLAGTYDGTDWNLYRNGILVTNIVADTTDGDNGPANVDPTFPWTIGARTPDSLFVGQAAAFGGSIAEPVIFGTALQPSDIMNLYNAAEVPPVITQAPVNPGTTSSTQP
jgi:hypothetical protein